MNQLPYITDNHEYFITFNKSKATIVCKFNNAEESFENPVTFEEFNEMIETAAIKGIKKIDFNCNYSIEVQRCHWGETAKKYNIKLTRISN